MLTILGSLIRMRKWGCQCQLSRPSYVEVAVEKARQGSSMLGLGAPTQPGSHLTALQNSVLEIAFMPLLRSWFLSSPKIVPSCLLWTLLFGSYRGTLFPFWLKPRSMPDIAKFNFLLWYSIFWTFWSQRLAVSSSVSDFDIFGTIITPLLLKVLPSSVSRSKSLFALPSPALAHP